MDPKKLALYEVKLRCRLDHGLILTAHAAERMLEMGVTPAQLGLIVEQGSSWPQTSTLSGRSGQLHWHPAHPDWGVVTDPDDSGLVITVVFRNLEQYERQGKTFEEVRADKPRS